MQRGGFDAVIGNPPFLGGRKSHQAVGTNMREWFVNVIAGGARGNADLVAYFFLRAAMLLGRTRYAGFIATNTVAQGDSREVGLDQMVASGFTLVRAIQSRSWPASSANLEYAAVWGTLGPVSDYAERVVDGQLAKRISSMLEPETRVSGSPERLTCNRSLTYNGVYLLGKGFVVDHLTVEDWTAADPRNAEVLAPYLNGEDVNSRPDLSASRWAIDFRDLSEEEAATYDAPFRHLYSTVRLERAHGSTAVARAPWWRHFRMRSAMRKAICTRKKR